LGKSKFLKYNAHRELKFWATGEKKKKEKGGLTGLKKKTVRPSYVALQGAGGATKGQRATEKKAGKWGEGVFFKQRGRGFMSLVRLREGRGGRGSFWGGTTRLLIRGFCGKWGGCGGGEREKWNQNELITRGCGKKKKKGENKKRGRTPWLWGWPLHSYGSAHKREGKAEGTGKNLG